MTILRIKKVWYVKTKVGSFTFISLENAIDFAIRNARFCQFFSVPIATSLQASGYRVLSPSRKGDTKERIKLL